MIEGMINQYKLMIERYEEILRGLEEQEQKLKTLVNESNVRAKEINEIGKAFGNDVAKDYVNHSIEVTAVNVQDVGRLLGTIGREISTIKGELMKLNGKINRLKELQF